MHVILMLMVIGFGAYLVFKFYKLVLGCLLLGVVAVVIMLIFSGVLRLFGLAT